MFDSRKQNPDCNFAEEIISYIYDEMRVSEKFQFESHLAECITCSKNVSAFSNVSNSLSEWRDEEFAQLETPKIEIPYEITVNSQIETIEKVNISWLDSLKSIFNFSPVFLKSATAFGTIAILLGLGWFMFGTESNNNKQIADSVKESENQEESLTPNKLLVDYNVEKETTNDSIDDIDNTKNIKQDTEVKKVTASYTRKSDSKKKTIKNKSTKTKKASKETIIVKQNKKSTPIKVDKELKISTKEKIEIQELPNLTDFAIEESEENDLRLTDLFEDVESGD